MCTLLSAMLLREFWLEVEQSCRNSVADVGLWMSQMTCPGLSLPIRERPLLPASVTQGQFYAPLMAGGLRPLQRKGSMLL